MNRRILVKLSGESLKNDSKDIICEQELQDVTRQLIELSKNYQVGVVVGGGNIWRGKVGVKVGMKRTAADYMGMLATMMNGLALHSALKRKGAKTILFSALEARKVAEPHIVREANHALDEGNICIFSGGTGAPFFTTDTTSALRASEIGAEVILMAKNGIDGIYDSDPNLNPNAKRFDNLTFEEVIQRGLKVMDTTALTLCQENNIMIKVFNSNAKDSLLKAVNNEIKMTVVK